ncbi:MAG: hypothetical protein NkDv07_0133 [Candidatus Improbicoccus devescovinae]|nr:MAG: hypothetical protein NkDv07_0133 [Candidatus Improbicoccus devescovinae]
MGAKDKSRQLKEDLVSTGRLGAAGALSVGDKIAQGLKNVYAGPSVMKAKKLIDPFTKGAGDIPILNADLEKLLKAGILLRDSRHTSKSKKDEKDQKSFYQFSDSFIKLAKAIKQALAVEWLKVNANNFGSTGFISAAIQQVQARIQITVTLLKNDKVQRIIECAKKKYQSTVDEVAGSLAVIGAYSAYASLLTVPVAPVSLGFSALALSLAAVSGLTLYLGSLFQHRGVIAEIKLEHPDIAKEAIESVMNAIRDLKQDIETLAKLKKSIGKLKVYKPAQLITVTKDFIKEIEALQKYADDYIIYKTKDGRVKNSPRSDIADEVKTNFAYVIKRISFKMNDKKDFDVSQLETPVQDVEKANQELKSANINIPEKSEDIDKQVKEAEKTVASVDTNVKKEMTVVGTSRPSVSGKPPTVTEETNVTGAPAPPPPPPLRDTLPSRIINVEFKGAISQTKSGSLATPLKVKLSGSDGFESKLFVDKKKLIETAKVEELQAKFLAAGKAVDNQIVSVKLLGADAALIKDQISLDTTAELSVTYTRK